MIAFLADENISPESADHLENLGYPCHSLRREGPWRLSDSEIVAMAQREGRIILTHDLDFGEIYYFAMGGEVGIIVLRLRHQTVEAVSDVGALPQGTGLNRRGAPARWLSSRRTPTGSTEVQEDNSESLRTASACRCWMLWPNGANISDLEVM